MIRPQYAEQWDISIHALHEESDRWPGRCRTRRPSFQSTLSMRRATITLADFTSAEIISIHALHEESDTTGFSV